MLQEWTDFLRAHFPTLSLLALGWVVAFSTLRYFWLHSKGRISGEPPPGSIIYEESFASGRSMKSWRTRWGGAAHCLKVTLTGNRLVIRPLLPFLVFGWDFDLVHTIPIASIESVTGTSGLLQDGVRIRFHLADAHRARSTSGQGSRTHFSAR